MRRNLNAFKFPLDKAILLPAPDPCDNGGRGQNNIARRFIPIPMYNASCCHVAHARRTDVQQVKREGHHSRAVVVLRDIISPGARRWTW